MKCICWQRPDGGVSIQHITPRNQYIGTLHDYERDSDGNLQKVLKTPADYTDEQWQTYWQNKTRDTFIARKYAGSVAHEIEDTDLPTDSYFRNAWTWSD